MELMVEGVVANKFVEGGGGVLIIVVLEGVVRGTQRQFSENICSEDELRYRFFGTFVVKFLACLPLLGFSNTYGIIAQFLTDSYPKKVSKNFRGLFSG